MKIIIFLACWLLSAIGISASGLLVKIPPPAIQAILLILTIIVIVVYFSSKIIQKQLLAAFPRGIISFHIIRFIGVYFLYLHSIGRLPSDFAIPAGWGDIIVATFALAIVALPALYKNRQIILGWNILGFIDILLVVASAARINLTRPGELNELTHLPLSLLPTFIVPLVISTHVFIFHIFLNSISEKPDQEP